MKARTIIVGIVAALLMGTVPMQPAEASWHYTCKTSRDEHTHWLRERIHVWKNVTEWHEGGRYYVRGTWATINMNTGEQIASDRRTYDCTGAG